MWERNLHILREEWLRETCFNIILLGRKAEGKVAYVFLGCKGEGWETARIIHTRTLLASAERCETTFLGHLGQEKGS